MPFIFNGESPKILTYNGNDVLKFISRIGGANDLIWQKATITAPSNLKVNGAASSTSSSCKLTWDAAAVTGSGIGITYHIYKDGTEYATTAGTSYTFSASEITVWSNVSLTVAAYNEDAGYSSQTSAVVFTYKAPASISSPYNLKVNGLSSDTDSHCNLTWSAATLSNASGGITYYIYKDGTQVATTTDTSYSFSASTIANWSGASLKVDAYNSEAGWSGYSNTVTFTYKAKSATVTVNASKYADTDNSTYANTGGSSCVVGRSTTDAPVGTAMQFLPPSGGWSQFSKATLHVYRNGGTASGTVRVHKLSDRYSSSIKALQAYYGNIGTSIGSVSVAGGNGWFTIDVASDLPASGEFAITLVCRDSYMVVDGTNAYISLSN
nr:MAG TPA: Prolactin, Prolactin receptor dependence, hematopoietic cytokine, HORMONE-HORMONE.8A [Caudoviricetes sp.]